MTLGDLLTALRRFRLPALGLFVMIFAIGVGSLVVQPSRYESAAVVSVSKDDGSLSFDAQQAVEFVIPPIVKRLTSPGFEQRIRDRLLPRFANAPIEIAAANEPGTVVINFTARSSSPAAALNATQVALAQIRREPPPGDISIKEVSPAAPATSVKAAQAPRILGGTFLLGLIAAVLAAAILHRLRPAIPRAERFRERYGHEVLGEIPLGTEPGGQTTSETFNASGSPELVEAFRSLEARLSMRVVASGRRDLNMSIAVTSWGDHDGKSTVATNLAWSLATRGRRVTLADCDLRRPSAHTLLSVPLAPGVADIAEGRPVLSMCQETVMRTLDVIPAGTPDRHPSEILHEALPRLLAALRNRTVIVDTPPMFTAEATAIVGEADFVVLVADYRKRTPDEIGEAIGELERSGTPILGVVLNRVTERDTAGRESYAYRSEEEDRQEQEQEQEPPAPEQEPAEEAEDKPKRKTREPRA